MLGFNLRVVRELSDLAHLRPRRAPWVITGRCFVADNHPSATTPPITDHTSGPETRWLKSKQAGLHTFAHLDLDAGVALGDILDAPDTLRHLGRC